MIGTRTLTRYPLPVRNLEYAIMYFVLCAVLPILNRLWYEELY